MFERYDLRQVGIKQEASYGVIPAGAWSSIAVWGDRFIPKQKMHQKKHAKQGLYHNKYLRGTREGDLAFWTYFQSRGTGAATLTGLLGHCMGGSSDRNAVSTTVSSVADRVSFQVATGTLGVNVGDYIAVEMNSGLYEIVEVTQISVGAPNDTIGIWPALSSVLYSAGNTVQGCRTYYEAGAPADSYAFLEEGENVDDAATFAGGVGSVSLLIDPAHADGPFPYLNFSFKYQNGQYLGAGLSSPEYWEDDSMNPVPLENVVLIVNGFTAGARDLLWTTRSIVGQFSWDLGWDLRAQRDAGSTSTIYGFTALGGENLMKGTVKMPWSTGLETALRSETEKNAILRWGHTPTLGGGALSLKRIQFTAVTKVDYDGQDWADVGFVCLRHADVHTTPETDLDKAGAALIMLG